MVFARDTDGRNATVESFDIARQALEAMPRARDLGAAALDFIVQKDRKVMSGSAFVVAIRRAIEDIIDWSDGNELNAEVRAFTEITDEELRHLQSVHHFSGVQVTQWHGEMKMQLFEAQHTSLH